MELMHPELRRGLAEEHIRARPRRTRSPVGRDALRRFVVTVRVARRRSGVERLVDEPVGELVVLAAHRGVRDGAEAAPERGSLSESVVRAAFLTLYSPRICFTRSSESETTSSSVTPCASAASSPAIERAVLRDVVRGDADRLAARVEHRPVLRLEDVAVRGRARGSRARRRPSRASPSQQLVDVEGRLLVRVRARAAPRRPARAARPGRRSRAAARARAPRGPARRPPATFPRRRGTCPSPPCTTSSARTRRCARRPRRTARRGRRRALRAGRRRRACGSRRLSSPP